MIPDEEILTILEKKEKRRFFHQLQSRSEEEGHIPPMPFLFFRNMAYPLQYIGGYPFRYMFRSLNITFYFYTFCFPFACAVLIRKMITLLQGKINSYGWRDKELSLKKPQNTYRIAVLGDSLVEAFQVESDRTFLALTEQQLNEEHKLKVELMNFGHGGYTK